MKKKLSNSESCLSTMLGIPLIFYGLGVIIVFGGLLENGMPFWEALGAGFIWPLAVAYMVVGGTW